MNGNHLKHMLLGGAGAFGVLLLVGVPLASALFYAVLLACPLMMITMGGHGDRGHDHSSPGGDTGSSSRPSTRD